MTGVQIKQALELLGIVPATIEHRGIQRITLKFDLNDRNTRAVKQLPGRQWSAGIGAWHIPRDKKILEQLLSLLGYNQEGNELPVLLNEEHQNNASGLVSHSEVQLTHMADLPEYRILPYLEKLSDKIQLRGYSYNTLKCYRNHFQTYLRVVISIKDIDAITAEEIERYLRWRQQQKSYSESDQNLHINAIKFYYEVVLGRARMLFQLPRPVKPKQLPAVWAEEDVLKLLKSLTNIKHRTMLVMAYAHGLRVSEVSSLKLADIDSRRMQIHIKAAKGKKDRMVNLSQAALELMRAYYIRYRPLIYLFENATSGEPISIRTIQEVFKAAKTKAGLLKKAGMHSLRHSFATHLHEQGIDIKYLKDLLGHNSIKTTERYTHVSKRDISRIKSPFDNLDLNS